MTRRLKKSVAFMLPIAMTMVALTACGAKPTTTTGNPTTMPKATTMVAKSDANGTRSFTDSVGRTVTLPEKLERIAPSGPLAQTMLLTVFPDSLCGIASKFAKPQAEYFPAKLQSLPEFGQFYGKNSKLNMEALAAAKPQVIVDIGEPKKTVKEDMDELSKKLNIPTVFIEAKLGEMPKAYAKIAELYNVKDDARLKTLIDTSTAILESAKQIGTKVPTDKRVKIFWAIGDDGLNTNATKSFQAEAVELANAVNVVDLNAVSSGGGTKVSFEQLYVWKPAVILADNANVAKAIKASETWQKFLKDTGAKVLEIPGVPFGFMANPPSVNRLLGVNWLSNALYPTEYATASATLKDKNLVEIFFGKSAKP